jgi:BRCA2, oligonucleotide/oligosaccharide-binding, domain 1
MVLCISNVTWSEAGLTPDGLPVPPKAELEVTDGWYRLRAQVDAPLSRAIKRGLIQVGRKIAIAGAKVSVCCSSPLSPGRCVGYYTAVVGTERASGNIGLLQLDKIDTFGKRVSFGTVVREARVPEERACCHAE